MIPMPNRGIPPPGPFGYVVSSMVGPPLPNMPPEENLDDWAEHTDKTSSRIYYYNKKTKQSKWTKPVGFLTQKEKLTPVSSQKIADTEWCVVFTRGGQSYYHNELTKETTWTLPESLNTPKPIGEKGNQNDANEANDANQKKRKLSDLSNPILAQLEEEDSSPSNEISIENQLKKPKLNSVNEISLDIKSNENIPVPDTEYDPLEGTEDNRKEEIITTPKPLIITPMTTPPIYPLLSNFNNDHRHIIEKNPIPMGETKEQFKNKKEEKPKIKKEELMKKEESPKIELIIKKDSKTLLNEPDKDDIPYEERIRIFKEMLSEKKNRTLYFF